MIIKKTHESLNLLAQHLIARRVVVMACDTIYGFVGVSPDTESEIRKIKGRGDKNPFLCLISNKNSLENFNVLLPDNKEILNLWPGPFTFIFPCSPKGSIALRIPKDERLRKLISRVGMPLFSTSVNRSGENPLNNPKEIESSFGLDVALIEDSGIYTEKKASTLISLCSNPYKIIRQGTGLVPPELLLS